jgi:hypothetical protein
MRRATGKFSSAAWLAAWDVIILAGALATPATLASSDRVASRVTSLFLHNSQVNANNDICVT